PLHAALPRAGPRAERDRGRGREAVHRRAHGGRDRRAAGRAVRAPARGRDRAGGARVPSRDGRARAHPVRALSDGAPRPYTLVAELTYRCPLRCVYCSNPLDYASHRDALETADWLRVFREAEALGVVQLNLTGGEPLIRDDLEAMVEAARGLDL